MTYFWIVLVAVYGLMTGSFINAFVWRFHELHDENLQLKKLNAKQRAKLSIVAGRSMCPACKHKLCLWDLIPVVSWVWLRGKCRYCYKSISKQYPVVELATAFLFGVSYIVWPGELSGLGIGLFALWLILVGFFVTLTIYDVRWQLLPDKIVQPFIMCSLLYVCVQLIGSTTRIQDVIGYISGVAVCSGLFFVLYQMSDGRWIGGGDVKLGIGLGLLAGGFFEGFLLISFASIIGLIFSVPLLLRKSIGMKSKIAFGPMLMLACYIVVLFGERIVGWYGTYVLLV